MKIKLLLLATAIFLFGCKNKSVKTETQDIDYGSYFNERYDYKVDCPLFLIPQGESESEDGQAFVSEDSKSRMLVYRTFKALTGYNPTIEAAFDEDMQTSRNVIEKQQFSNYYFIKGELDENTLYKTYTILENDEYFVIYFEYPKDDEDLFESICQYVYESFKVGAGVGNIEHNEFVMFLEEFLNDCFWDVNFNSLLKNNDQRLAKYIDPQMDIRRYYNPGSVAYLYTRDDNFGFEDFNDFDTKANSGGKFSIKELSYEAMPCELDFNQQKGSIEIYFWSVGSFPYIVVDTETFEMQEVTLPYPDAEKIAVYLPDYYKDNVNVRAFYFVNTPSGWKIAFVDDSLCSA